ncbi:uncharacterized protein ColSpa_12567 [Colletotrichum spaethianum]|uniref:Uncharacterized protein n=1 Tax=Colletotrichum spaethianum TaxID=700344 RepID=A0AA37PHE8_9PEZI|nr:uncharacterized protein ColSpa_12567 [Colletotrichum spaethianum]GKT52386.1 hypothetical protein ColSpa_12567 [Colletotrichum spaethianum]
MASDAPKPNNGPLIHSAEDWVPSFKDGKLNLDESEDDGEVQRILTLLTGGQPSALKSTGILSAWKQMVQAWYPQFLDADLAWVGTEYAKFMAMQLIYINSQKPFESMGFEAPYNAVTDVDQGYLKWLCLNHPDFYEANKHRVPQSALKAEASSPTVPAIKAGPSKDPVPAANAGASSSSSKQATHCSKTGTAPLQPNKDTKAPVQARASATVQESNPQPSNIDALVEASRQEREDLF